MTLKSNLVLEYDDKNVSITIDLKSKSIRVFTYDVMDEWKREHSFNAHQAGTAINGSLDDLEFNKLHSLSALCLTDEYTEKPIEFHGLQMVHLSINDYTVILKSYWNENTKAKNPTIILAKHIKSLRFAGKTPSAKKTDDA